MGNLSHSKPQDKSSSDAAGKPIGELSAEALFAACKLDHRASREPNIARNWAYRPARSVRS